MQYTIRGIPAAVDDALRARARAAGKSLNEVVVDALAAGAGVTATPRKRRDLSDVAGAWKTDKAVESALAAQDEPDEGLWNEGRTRHESIRRSLQGARGDRGAR